MPAYVSASSRLHALLSALGRVQNAQPLRGGWSEVLGVAQADVQFGGFGLSAVAKLVSGAGQEAARAEKLFGLPLQPGLVQEWSKPVYAPGGNLDAPIHQQAVSPEALTYLHSVASVLGKNEKQQELPGADELADLLAQIDELFASIEAATDLADDVKAAVLRRIAHVRLAVQNARIGGTEGVHEAVELLLGATAVRQNAMPKSMIKRVLAVAGIAYAVFAAGPMIQESLEAWPQAAETLHLISGATQDTDQADEHEAAEHAAESKP